MAFVRTSGSILTMVAAIGMAATPAMARKASTLTDINGMRASSAEGELQDRGFKYIDGHKGGYGSAYSNWWHAGDRDCVTVEVMDGKVMTINDVAAQDCGHTEKGHSGAGTAVAAVAGAALIGALLSHKSKHHDDGEHYDDHSAEQQYERG